MSDKSSKEIFPDGQHDSISEHSLSMAQSSELTTNQMIELGQSTSQVPDPQQQPPSSLPNPVQQAAAKPTDPLMQVPDNSQASVVTPAIADDADLIEKEWVQRAKHVVDQTSQDPYAQNQEVNKIKADYIKKRYGRDIKLAS